MTFSEHFELIVMQLLNITHKIDICLKNADWDGLQEHLEIRQKYFEDFFSYPISEPLQKKKVITLINATVEKDGVDIQRLKAQMREIDRQRKEYLKSQKAVNAYQKS